MVNISQDSLGQLHIPLVTQVHGVRRSLPARLLRIVEDLQATELYANIEYEVDELRRDIQLAELAKPKNINTIFVHNKCVVEPGVVMKKDGTAYSVNSFAQRH